MRRPSHLIILAALAFSLTALWPTTVAASSPCTTVIMIPALLPADASSIAIASEHLVWDRQTGTAVAEIYSDKVALLPARLNFTVAASPLDFQSALDEAIPSYRAESLDGMRFATKEPATMVRPANAPHRPPNSVKQVESSTCLFEGFEVLPIWFENGGPWMHYEGCAFGGSGCKAYNNVGNYFWLDVSGCDRFQGNWDAEAVMGGTIGETLPCGAAYPAYTDSWMEYYPAITCVSGVPQASLTFAYKALSNNAPIRPDFLFYGFALDGFNYVGYSQSGNWSDTWYGGGGDLRRWYNPAMDLTTYPYIYFTIAFQSGSRPDLPGPGFGARVDNISIAATSLSAVASADKTSGHPPLTVYFTGSVIGGQAPISYSWDFGDGSAVSTEQTPAHTYTAVGTYTPRLTVVDANGGMSTGALTINVTAVAMPTVSSMAAAGNPFRFIVNGVNFQQGIAVYINGYPWANVVWKNSNKVVIKGGSSLKATVPKGVPATFLFENPDGDTGTFTFSW